MATRVAYREDVIETDVGTRPGRPRDQALDRALLDAAARLIVKHGYGALTLQAVADEASTTRPALYRRFRDRADLIVCLLADRYGVEAGPFSGGLEAELRASLHQQAEMFNDMVLTKAIPGLVDDLSRLPGLTEDFLERFLRPRRASTIAILQRAVANGEIEPGFDSEWICDLMTGPSLTRAVLPGLGPIDDVLVEQTLAITLRALGYQA